MDIILAISPKTIMVNLVTVKEKLVNQDWLNSKLVLNFKATMMQKISLVDVSKEVILEISVELKILT